MVRQSAVRGVGDEDRKRGKDSQLPVAPSLGPVSPGRGLAANPGCLCPLVANVEKGEPGSVELAARKL